MSPVKIGILIVGAIIFIIALIIHSGWRPTGMTIPSIGGPKKLWKNWWVDGRALPILACFALIHFSIYKIFPGFWMDQYSKPWFWGIPLAIALIASIKPEDKAKPVKYKLSTVTMILLSITFIIQVVAWKIKEDPIGKLVSAFASNNATPGPRGPRLAPSISMGTPACFQEQLGPDKDAAFAAFPGQMDLLAVLCRESRFYHLDPESGSVNINENKRDGVIVSTDTGIAQINSAHDAELDRLKLDKNKLEDNLKYAGILYEKNGLLDWTPRLDNNKVLTFEVNVEAGKESAAFKLPYRDLREFLCDPDQEALAIITDERGVDRELTIYPLKEHKFVDVDAKQIRSYRFKSKNDKKLLVTVTYQY